MTWVVESDKSTTWSSFGRARENLIPYSSDFDYWLGLATVSGDTIISDGSASVNVSRYVQLASLPTMAQNIDQCFSIKVLKDSVPAATRFCAIRIAYGTTTILNNTLHFDTSNGNTYQTGSSSIVVNGYGSIDDGDEWVIWVSSKCDQPIYRLSVFPAYGSGAVTNNPSAATTGSMTVISAQFESGTYPSRHIITNGNSVYWDTV